MNVQKRQLHWPENLKFVISGKRALCLTGLFINSDVCSPYSNALPGLAIHSVFTTIKSLCEHRKGHTLGRSNLS